VDEELVADLARAMLDRAATVQPERVAAERRVFGVLRAAYFADPKRALAGADRRTGKLEFGLDGAELLLTTVLLEASAQVVVELAAQGLVNGARATKRGVRRLLHLPPGADPEPDRGADSEPDADPTAEVAPTAEAAPTLTPAQWAQIRQVIIGVLIRYARMPKPDAELIAAAVIGDAVTGQPR
jgi:hypothetical protein